MMQFAYPTAVSTEPSTDADVAFTVTLTDGRVFGRFVDERYARHFKAYLIGLGRKGVVRHFKVQRQTVGK